jgi:hypothetical protein
VVVGTTGGKETDRTTAHLDCLLGLRFHFFVLVIIEIAFVAVCEETGFDGLKFELSQLLKFSFALSIIYLYLPYKVRLALSFSQG